MLSNIVMFGMIFSYSLFSLLQIILREICGLVFGEKKQLIKQLPPYAHKALSQKF